MTAGPTTGPAGWVTAAGSPTDAGKGWNGGAPYWREAAGPPARDDVM